MAGWASGIATLLSGSSSPYKQAMGAGGATIATESAYGPQQFELNRLYSAPYLGLGSYRLQQLLFGAPEQTYSVPGSTFGTGAPDVSYTTAAMPGLIELLGLAGGQLRDLGLQGEEETLGARLGQFGSMAPQLSQLFDQLSPELRSLRRNLASEAETGLKLGGRLAPEDTRRITNSVRSSFANRGLGASPAAQLSEAMQLFLGGDQMRQQRQQFAADTTDVLAGSEPNSLAALLGLSGEDSLYNAASLLGSQEPLAYSREVDMWDPTAVSAANLGGQLKFAQKQALANSFANIDNQITSAISGIV